MYQNTPNGNRQVNLLFKADFFGEKALLSDAPRNATVEARTQLVALVLNRQDFIRLLGPLQESMAKEKSPQIVAQRMQKLTTVR